MNKLLVKKTQIEMLSDRGYLINKDEQKILTLDVTLKKNIKKYKDVNFNQVYTKNNNNLYVYYIDETDDQFQEFKQFVEDMTQYDSGMIIGMSYKDLNKKSYKKILASIPFKPIETFKYQNLAFNVTRTIYYDKHELIDKSTIINMANIDELPKILLKDKIVRYFNYQIGDVIKITRQYTDINLLSQSDIGYRVVVETV